MTHAEAMKIIKAKVRERLLIKLYGKRGMK